MANTRQSTKRAKQNEKRRIQNQIQRSKAKTAVKSAVDAITGKNAKSAEVLHEAIRALSKASSKGVIPQRRAARKISRLSQLAKKMGATA